MKTANPAAIFERSRRERRRSAAAWILAAGMAWPGFAADAMVMTTWTFPANAEALSAEATNNVVILHVGEAVDGFGSVVLYRTSDGLGIVDKLADGEFKAGSSASAPGGGDGTQFESAAMAGFSMVRGIGGKKMSHSGQSIPNFTAEDKAEYYVNKGLTSWGTEEAEKGSGWGRWITTGASLSSRVISEDGQFFVAGGAGGDGGTGRTFEDAKKLDSGMFSVNARHDFTDAFSGFAVYGDSGELVRFGVTTALDRNDPSASNPKLGFWYSTAGNLDYQFFGDFGDAPTSTLVQYELAWQTFGDGLRFDVTVSGAWVPVGVGEPMEQTFSFSSGWINVSEVSAVSAVGVVVASNKSGETIRFNNVVVTGHAIPEPGTFSLLLLALPVLARRRPKG